jgi:HEAT repeat protein
MAWTNIPPRGVTLLAAALFAAAVAPSAHATPTAASASARQAADEVIALLTTGDGDMQEVALETIRQGLRGGWFTEAVAATLPRLAAPAQEAVLLALADRGDIAAVPAARTILSTSKDAGVRAAAVALLGRLGGVTEVPTLVDALAAGGRERDAARRGLVEIRIPAGSDAIRAAAAAAAPPTKAAIIDVLAERRDRGALPLLGEAVVDGDAAVRQAAMRALARFGGPAEIPAMMASVLRATGDERKAAELAIAAVCASGPKGDDAAGVLVARYAAADEPSQRLLLPALARVGGPQVMAIVDAMLVDPAKRSRGLDALSKWPDATVKDRLLDLLAKTTDAKEKELLLGTLIRIAPLPDNKLNDGQKLDLLVKTMALCERPEDKARVLERANAIRTIETFRFVVPYLDDPALAEPACRSVVELAHHQKLRDAHKAEFTKALDKVLGITKNDELVERATRYKAGQTWDRNKKS